MDLPLNSTQRSCEPASGSNGSRGGRPCDPCRISKRGCSTKDADVDTPCGECVKSGKTCTRFDPATKREMTAYPTIERLIEEHDSRIVKACENAEDIAKENSLPLHLVFYALYRHYRDSPNPPSQNTPSAKNGRDAAPSTPHPSHPGQSEESAAPTTSGLLEVEQSAAPQDASTSVSLTSPTSQQVSEPTASFGISGLQARTILVHPLPNTQPDSVVISPQLQSWLSAAGQAYHQGGPPWFSPSGVQYGAATTAQPPVYQASAHPQGQLGHAHTGNNVGPYHNPSISTPATYPTHSQYAHYHHLQHQPVSSQQNLRQRPYSRQRAATARDTGHPVGPVAGPAAEYALYNQSGGRM